MSAIGPKGTLHPAAARFVVHQWHIDGQSSKIGKNIVGSFKRFAVTNKSFIALFCLGFFAVTSIARGATVIHGVSIGMPYDKAVIELRNQNCYEVKEPSPNIVECTLANSETITVTFAGNLPQRPIKKIELYFNTTLNFEELCKSISEQFQVQLSPDQVSPDPLSPDQGVTHASVRIADGTILTLRKNVLAVLELSSPDISESDANGNGI